MRHRKRTLKLGRTSAHLRATLRSLTVSLFTHGRVVTTLAYAKACRPFAEKLITTARSERGTAVNRFRTVLSRLHHKAATQRLFKDVAPLAKDRAGGYTRILKLPATRLGDNSPTALLELVDRPEVKKEEKKAGLLSRLVGGGKDKKAEKASGEAKED